MADKTTSQWRPIDEAPKDFGTRGGAVPVLLVRDCEGKKWMARRTNFNNSGWLEDQTNREIWPVYWMDPNG